MGETVTHNRKDISYETTQPVVQDSDEKGTLQESIAVADYVIDTTPLSAFSETDTTEMASSQFQVDVTPKLQNDRLSYSNDEGSDSTEVNNQPQNASPNAKTAPDGQITPQVNKGLTRRALITGQFLHQPVSEGTSTLMESNPETLQRMKASNPATQINKRITRRKFLGISLATVTMAFLSACGVKPPRQEEPEEKKYNELPIPPEIQAIIEEGKNLRTPEDLEMLKTTPGIDLPLFSNERIKAIRSEQDLQRRILLAIGFLDVQNSLRYDFNRLWLYTCNVYATDLMRIILDTHNDEFNGTPIGSRYTPTQLLDLQQYGRFLSMGQEEYNQNVDIIGNFPQWDSNTIDGIFGEMGPRLGWRKVTTQKELEDHLKNGHVAMAVSSKELIEEQKRRRAIDPSVEEFTGHSLVVFGLQFGNKFYYGFSQSTNNYELVIRESEDPYYKVNPEAKFIERNQDGEIVFASESPAFSYWVHLPTKYN